MMQRGLFTIDGWAKRTDSKYQVSLEGKGTYQERIRLSRPTRSRRCCKTACSSSSPWPSPRRAETEGPGRFRSISLTAAETSESIDDRSTPLGRWGKMEVGDRCTRCWMAGTSPTLVEVGSGRV